MARSRDGTFGCPACLWGYRETRNTRPTVPPRRRPAPCSNDGSGRRWPASARRGGARASSSAHSPTPRPEPYVRAAAPGHGACLTYHASRGDTRLESALIGRQAELQPLVEAVDGACAAEAAIVLIGDQAGNSTTRMISDIVSGSEEGGVLVLQWCVRNPSWRWRRPALRGSGRATAGIRSECPDLQPSL